MKLGVGSRLFQSKHDTRSVTVVNNSVQQFGCYLSFEEKPTANQNEMLDTLEIGQSKFDKFFDETGGERNLHDAFDSFDEVVFVDDATDVDLDQLDDELATHEYYR